MHIMLFGGSFDPPHRGHQQIARFVIGNNIADQLWYVPCNQHPFAKQLTPGIHRLAMLHLLTNKNCLINNYELKQNTVSYSVDTLKYFQGKFPIYQFSWLIGSDQLPSFPKWKEYQKLLKKWKVYVYPRNQYPMDNILNDMIAIANAPNIEGISSQIRELIRNHQSITNLVDPMVEKYIYQHHLYKK